MTVFDFSDYKEFVRESVKGMPKAGHGEFRKIASHLRMHTTMVSHIFGGSKHLTLEQAVLLAEHLGLNDLKAEYFVLLVQYERAGSVALKRMLRKQLDEIKERANRLVERLPRDKVLNESEKALFYSNWHYSGIRLLTSIPQYQTVDEIAEYFDLPRATVSKIVDFLLSVGLCKEKCGALTHGPMRTHIEASSPLASRHHTNWRLKAMERFMALDDDELVFTTPVTIAKKDAHAIRKMIVEFIEKLDPVLDKSEPESLHCLNIDWVKIKA